MEMNIISALLQATLLAQIIFGILIFMSVSSWAVMLRKWIEINTAKKKSSFGIGDFERAKDLREAVQRLGLDQNSPLYAVAQEGVKEFNRSKEARNSDDVVVDNVRRALRQGVGMEISRLHSSLSYLATAANTAPFIGLLGTVWGIIHSFHSIGMMKSASLATVAPGISEALVATAVGLFVAIPATVGYNSFQGKLAEIDTLLVHFAGSFLNRVQRELNSNRANNTAGRSAAAE